MEGGGPFFRAQPQYELPASGPLEQEGNGGNNENSKNPNNNEVQQRVPGREQEQFMPIANVASIIHQVLPSHAKISDDAKEIVQECASEFISYITNEANQRCRDEQRKIVTTEDILWAIEKLGFDDYVGPLSLFLSHYRDSGNDNSSKASSSHVPHHVMRMNEYYYGDIGSGDGSSSSVSGSPMYYGDGSSSSVSGSPMYYDPYGHLMKNYHPQ